MMVSVGESERFHILISGVYECGELFLQRFVNTINFAAVIDDKSGDSDRKLGEFFGIEKMAKFVPADCNSQQRPNLLKQFYRFVVHAVILPFLLTLATGKAKKPIPLGV